MGFLQEADPVPAIKEELPTDVTIDGLDIAFLVDCTASMVCTPPISACAFEHACPQGPAPSSRVLCFERVLALDGTHWCTTQVLQKPGSPPALRRLTKHAKHAVFTHLQGWCIKQVKTKIQGIVDELTKAHPGTGIRIAFVAYRDFGAVPQSEVRFTPGSFTVAAIAQENEVCLSWPGSVLQKAPPLCECPMTSGCGLPVSLVDNHHAHRMACWLVRHVRMIIKVEFAGRAASRYHAALQASWSAASKRKACLKLFTSSTALNMFLPLTAHAGAGLCSEREQPGHLHSLRGRPQGLCRWPR
jgi:hypothetical protein